MLSAIAARKAAQAAQLTQEAPVYDTSPQKTPPDPSLHPSSSESDLESSPPRKRKAQERDSPRKKRQKTKIRQRNPDFARPRYFEAPRPIQGFDDEPTFGSEVTDESPSTSRARSPNRLVPNNNLAQHEDTPSGFISEPLALIRGYSPSRPVADSSEDEDNIQRNDPGLLEPGVVSFSPEPQKRSTTFTPRPDSNIFQLSSEDFDTLRLPSYAFVSGSAALLLMAPGQSLSFVGTACITLLHGAIALLGTPITPSLYAHRVYSPRSSPLVSLEALDAQSSTAEGSTPPLRCTLLNGGTLPHRVQNAGKVSDNIVIIQQMQTAVETLGKVCRTFEGVFGVDAELRRVVEVGSIGVEGLHIVDFNTHAHPQLQCFYLPESWTNALDAAVPLSSEGDPILSTTNSFISLVRGPKKCGKSTFARTLLNRLTTRYRHVAFLECDLGQSEFTPGGMVSLHVVSHPVFGPPFTHPRLPYRAHYVGHTTPHSNPSHYLSCIQALVQLYYTDVQYPYQETSTNDLYANGEETMIDDRIEGPVPLVVNTQGWIKGLGGDLLRKIEEIVGATHIYDFDMRNAMLPRQRMQPSSASIHTLHPIPTSPLAAYFTPADHRSLAILSYFHCVFPPQHTGPEDLQWVTDLPLCARLPWRVDCSEAIDQIILVGAGYEDVVPRELGHAINCGVVALVCDEERATAVHDRESSIDAPFRYTQGAPAPDPSASHCAGLALVRGVDAAAHALHFLTPLPPAELARCRVLVKGELELPVWGMLDFREQQDGVAGVPWEKVPYLQMGGRGSVVGAAGAGAGRKRVRRNLMRRGQM